MISFKDLVDAGQLKKETTSAGKINEYLEFADEEIRAALVLLPDYPAVAYKSAYDALIHAGTALIRTYGFRPTQKFTHVTITKFVTRVLGKENEGLVNKFERMRRKRHPLQYEAIFIESPSEVKGAIADAAELVEQIKRHISGKIGK